MSVVFYDFLAPAYDAAFEEIYRPFRAQALNHLPSLAGARVLDVACGTGQNFSLLADRVGEKGKIIGVDISAGMLKRAQARAGREAMRNVSLLKVPAKVLSASLLETETADTSIDFVISTYGFTSMRDWESAFEASWDLLRPGGGYLIHDIYAATRNWHSLAVETVTRCDFSQTSWKALRDRSVDFRMDYLDPSAHLFGGRLFVAYGTKPFLSGAAAHVPSD
jgi:ubiquinone/menaquinone biosynthesis C-methylase UbiE